MNDKAAISLRPIGIVRSSRKVLQDDHWEAEKAVVELDAAQFSPDSMLGLSDFSHVEILFYMDQVDATTIEYAARHPRNRGDWPKVGIFAQRAKNRPNQLGATICRVIKVEDLALPRRGPGCCGWLPCRGHQAVGR
jgi:tRNA (Thr-GGU) A37 N-methylase